MKKRMRNYSVWCSDVYIRFFFYYYNIEDLNIKCVYFLYYSLGVLIRLIGELRIIDTPNSAMRRRLLVAQAVAASSQS